jgi:ferredoxin-nitrite reductase
MAANDPFTEEQKQYLQGFLAGTQAARAAQGLPAAATRPPAAAPAACAPVAGPDAIHQQARERAAAAGKPLAAEEAAKRDKHPFEMWDEMRANAEAGRYPKGLDIFRYKFHGLFYVAPAQDAFMCRLRMPNGILNAHQLGGLARLAAELGGGYAHVTTRANLQIREIKAADALAVLEGLCDLGLTARGSGADNIRNVTGTPTAGIDPQELIDTRPLCKEWHHYVLNHREFYGLPRKFNVAFDGAGTIGVLADTNDIGFAAVRVGQGKAVPAGVYFRMQLGGITGHGDFARDSGVLLKPPQCTPAAAAVVRVFIKHGDRTDRSKARLKYLLEQWGLERFLAAAEQELGYALPRLPLADCEPRPEPVPHAHVGVHRQRQAGRSYIGVVLPAGRMTAEQMQGLAELAARHGSGTVRLTVWQNLLLPDIPDARIAAAQQEIEALGLHWKATSIRAGLVACTGNTGCKFSATDTKRHALAIADALEPGLALDQPVNIHLTGCPHSCAQHYVGDIGLLGAKLEAGGEQIEGYHLYVGGGAGANAALAREVARDIPADQVAERIGRLLRAYLARRHGAEESFCAFTRRMDVETLRALLAPIAQAAD